LIEHKYANFRKYAEVWITQIAEYDWTGFWRRFFVCNNTSALQGRY